jgi:hypothetical protein
MPSHAEDLAAIHAIIERQFASLNWRPGTQGDWAAFRADFFPGAALFPAARPANRQTVDAFVERMAALAQDRLKAFRERALGSEVRVFGNVAIAAATCEIVENEATVTRGVEMLLLIKDDGCWRIVAQGWDSESADKPIPPELLRGA